MADDRVRIKKALKNSYKKKQAAQLNGWTRDDSLSWRRSQVYASPNGTSALITHTGSKTVSDWAISNPALGAGLIGKTKRGKHATRATKQAVKKYDYVTVAGHSLGGGLAQHTGKVKGVDRVVTVNKGGPLTPVLMRRVPKKQTDYRHGLDPVSAISGGLMGDSGGGM